MGWEMGEKREGGGRFGGNRREGGVSGRDKKWKKLKRKEKNDTIRRWDTRVQYGRNGMGGGRDKPLSTANIYM